MQSDYPGQPRYAPSIRTGVQAVSIQDNLMRQDYSLLGIIKGETCENVRSGKHGKAIGKYFRTPGLLSSMDHQRRNL